MDAGGCRITADGYKWLWMGVKWLCMGVEGVEWVSNGCRTAVILDHEKFACRSRWRKGIYCLFLR